MSAVAPAVSVIIPARGAAAQIGLCLDALLAGDRPPGGMEILVAGLPGDAVTKALALAAARRRADCPILWVDNPSGSTPAGLNAALSAARGDVILRMDAHARPAPGYVTACLAALEATGASCVGGGLRGRGETAWGRAVALAWTHPLGAGDAAFRRGGAGPVDTVYLGAWPRAVLSRLGGFDEALTRNQDYELALRIRAAGGTVWLDPAIQSSTLTRGTAAGLIRQYWGYGQGRAATCRKHPRSLRARQLLPALWTAALALGLLLAIVRPDLRAWLLLPPAAYLLILAGAAVGWARRAPLRDLWLLPGVLICMHLSWGLGFWRGLLRGRPGPASPAAAGP